MLVEAAKEARHKGTSKKITFGAKNKAKLSTAQLASVTDKGWVLG